MRTCVLAFAFAATLGVLVALGFLSWIALVLGFALYAAAFVATAIVGLRRADRQLERMYREANE